MLGPAPAAQAYYKNQGTAFNPPFLFGLATVDATPLTARRTQSLQDEDGVIALLSDITAATGTLSLAFSFNDANTSPVGTIPAGQLVKSVEVQILTAFDGTGAMLTVGDAGQVDRLLSAASIDAGDTGIYSGNPGYAYPVDTVVNVYITPGFGATAGAGWVTIEFT